MSKLTPILVLLAAFIAVFAEASFNGIRSIFGAQVDLLPALVVYASLSAGIVTMTLVAVLGGLLFDSLSANPLGITIMPLFIVGFVIFSARESLLRSEFYAQCVLGLAASAAVPLMTLLVLLTAGHGPQLGWRTLWQFVVMTVGGGIATPLLFKLFGFFEGALSYTRMSETTFRSDRQIRRSRR